MVNSLHLTKITYSSTMTLLYCSLWSWLVSLIYWSLCKGGTSYQILSKPLFRICMITKAYQLIGWIFMWPRSRPRICFYQWNYSISSTLLVIFCNTFPDFLLNNFLSFHASCDFLGAPLNCLETVFRHPNDRAGRRPFLFAL